MKRSHIVLFALCFMVFETLLVCFVDRPLSEYLRSVDQTNPALIDFFRSYTDLAKGKWNILAFGVATLLCAVAARLPQLKRSLRSRMIALGQKLMFCFACLAASGIVTDILKTLIGRTRPVMLDREGLYGFHFLSFDARWQSMPSGHATTAFTLVGLAVYFFPKQWPYWTLIGLALVVSRVMVNAHYLADIFAGALVGSLTVYLMRGLINHNVTNHIRDSIFPIDRK